MKKLLIIALSLLALFFTSAVLAATSSGSVNINASIPGGGVPPIICVGSACSPIPAVCGNGAVETGEACDSGSGNGACPALCSSSCSVNTCNECIDPGCKPPVCEGDKCEPPACVGDKCGEEPPPTNPPIVVPGGGSNQEYPIFSFYVNNSDWPVASVSGRFSALAGYLLTIKADQNRLPKPVGSITARFLNISYPLVLKNGQAGYQISFRLPVAPQTATLEIVTIYTDKTVARQTWQVSISPWGRVSKSKSQENLPKVTVMIYKDGQPFVAPGVTNPQETDENGQYGFMVPNGDYVIRVDKENYWSYERRVSVSNNLINYQIDLDEQPVFVVESQKIIKSILDNQTAEKINTRYAAPAAAVIVSISAFLAIPWWNFIYYLQSLFTEPLAWLFRGRKKGWGVVYNSITKQPIDLAVVRLFDNQTKRLIQSKVTDRNGRYTMLVEPGEYYLQAVKPGFSFPSEILKNYREDSQYVDLYHNETITIAAGEQGIVSANIPLDQAEIKLTDRQVLRHHFFYVLKSRVIMIGPIFSCISLIVSPSWLIGGFTILHFALYFLFTRLGKAKKPKGWGKVFDNQDQKPIGGAVARIYSSQYNRMLEAQVTDRAGRYGFLAGDNVYYLTADKAGYATHKTDAIDLKSKKAEKIVSRNIPLEKKINSTPEIISQPLEIPQPPVVQPEEAGEKEENKFG